MIVHAQGSGLISFAADGTVNGSIQVADSTLFKVGAVVYVSNSDGLNVECNVVKIPDSTHIVVRRTNIKSYGTTDLTAYTLAKTSKVQMPAQILKGDDAASLHFVSWWTGLS